MLVLVLVLVLVRRSPFAVRCDDRMENGRPRLLLLTEPRHTPPKNFKHAKAKRRARTPVPQCALCATIDENLVFLRGFSREELCLPDQCGPRRELGRTLRSLRLCGEFPPTGNIFDQKEVMERK